MVMEKIKTYSRISQICLANADWTLHTYHITVSLEYGSPKKPAIAEAVALIYGR